MESELADCPVCGANLSSALYEWAGVKVIPCSSRVCAYVLIDTIPSRQAHNKLAREARVGRLE